MLKKCCAIVPGAMLTAFLLTSHARAQAPCKADVKFQFNVNFGPPTGMGSQPYKAPWFLYFPVDPYANTMGMGPTGSPMSGQNRFPNWPTQFPPPDAGGCSVQPFPQPGQPMVPSATSQMNYPNWPAHAYDRANGN